MEDNHFLFTSEAVSEGHPDKVADQISDAVLDAYLEGDSSSKVACETLVTTGQVIVAGEVRSSACVNVTDVVRGKIKEIGYNNPDLLFDGANCGVINLLHLQSDDINMGVERCAPEEQGAGDQGVMFGYATNETECFMPLPHVVANLILLELRKIRREGEYMTYLRPDAKSQVTVEYDGEGKPCHIDSIVVSTQHSEFILPDGELSQEDADKQMQERIYHEIECLVLPHVKEKLSKEGKYSELLDGTTKLLVNPTGRFVIGGPHGDTGLTGRKIIVDTYGGACPHGGGAFSGKDPSKVDRSAAYMARFLAKNMVAAGVAEKMVVQLSYAIGVAHPMSVFVDTRGTNKTKFTDAELSWRIKELFDLTPHGIIEKLGLRGVRYAPTAAYGHFGRENDEKLFTWERLSEVVRIKRALLT